MKKLLTLLVMALVIINASAQVPTNGLSAYYKFNGNPADSSGNGNHGLVIGGANLTADRFNNPNSAYQFNGTSQYIQINTNASIEPANAVSVNAWIFPESNSNQWAPVVSKRFASATDPYESYGIHWGNVAAPFNNKYYFGTSNGIVGSGKNAIQKGTLSITNWYMLTGVYDGNSISLYINGVYDTSIAFSGNLGYSSMPLLIGNNSQANQYFKGKIDDVSIHSRALTASEIAQMYNPQSLVAWYKFNGNAGDSSGYSNHGTVTGATSTTDRFGNANSAYQFNGTSNYILVPNSQSLQLQKAYTISLWINPETTTANQWTPVMTKRINNSTAPFDSYSFTKHPQYNNGRWIFGTNSKTNFISAFSNKTINYGGWQHLVATYDGQFVKLHIDGALDTVVAFTDTVSYSTLGLYFGTNSLSGQYYKGKIDDVMIYNRALTLNEIGNLFRQIKNNSIN